MLFLPDEIVDLSLEHLSYEGLVGISIEGLFQLISPNLQDLDDFYKSIVFSWLLPNKNIQFINADGEIVEKSQISNFEEFDSSKYLIRVTEEYQWLILTNTTKESNLIPNAAFQLLAEIAKHREKGIDSFSLTRATGQDARSLTQRIKVIGHLIKKTSIVKNGRSLSLFVLSKFSGISNHEDVKINNESGEITINIEELREKIVTALKVAKSKIRQFNDLRRELEMDKTKKYKRVFRSAVNYLSEKGYLIKVMVVSPISPTKKFRSFKYLKDYVKSDAQNDESSNDEEDDEEDENDDIEDELIDDELKDLEVNGPSASLKSAVDLEVLDATKSNIVIPSFNRIYPLQNQVYDLVNSLGTTGCSTNHIIQYIFGPSFQRLFNKLIQSYTSDKLLSYIANYGIIRHYDFQGRVKFYRYISRKNLLVYSKQPEDPNGSTFPPYKPSKSTIKQLNSKSFKPMVGSVGFYTENGEPVIAWTGPHSTSAMNISISASTGLPMRRRGRPKKDSVKIKEVESQEITNNLEIVEDKSTKSSDETKDEEPSVIITDIQGASFRSIETQAAILRLIEDSDGVKKNDNNLLNELREELGYNIFRATYFKDLDSLINQQKLYFENFVIDDEIGTTISLLITPTTNQSTISNYKNSILNEGKQNKYERAHIDELSLDIDSFDTELRETFNRAPPPPKIRIRAEKPVKPSNLPRAERGVKPTKTIKARLPKVEKQAIQIPSKNIKKVGQPFEPKEDDLFESIKKKNRVNKRKRRTNVLQSENKEEIIQETKPRVGKRNRRHMTNLSSEEALLFFKCAIICKTLTENQIDWTKVSDVTGHSIEVLKVKWPRIRTMMGPLGIKNARNTWKKLLISAVKEGKVDMEDVEELNLDILLDLWQDSELLGALDGNGEKLYANIEDNEKEYGFVKFKTPGLFYDNNSMIQREHCLIDNVSTYKEEDIEETIPLSSDEKSQDEKIRNIIIAIVASGTEQDIKKLGPLEQFNEEDVNRVFLEMSKNRELLISGSTNSVLLGDRLTSIIDDHSYLLSLDLIPKFQTFFHDLLESKKGLLLSPIFEDELMVSLLELISNDAINLTRVDHYRKDILTGYEARTIERDNFESEIIITEPKSRKSLIQITPERKIAVPSGKPCSHFWIGINGQINKQIWIKTLKIFVTSILSNPGITNSSLFQIVDPLLSRDDFELVLNWLIQTKAVLKHEPDGYWLEQQWYMALGL